MKQVSPGLNWFQKSSHGYWQTKSHFTGKLVREIIVTVFDTDTKQGSYGYVFLTEHNALISLLRKVGDLEPGVYEFTTDDSFGVTQKGDLKEILNATPGGEKTLSAGATTDMAFVTVNKRYYLLPDIQVDLTYGYSRLNLKTYYLNPKNYVETVGNLSKVIEVLAKQKEYNDTNMALPGGKAAVAMVNIYTGTMVTFLVPAVFLIILYLLLTGNLNLS